MKARTPGVPTAIQMSAFDRFDDEGLVTRSAWVDGVDGTSATVTTMEAMKMENILRAPKAATVKATPAKAGDSLAVDQVIVEFE
jgi:propionyl-CoA carboxylase alpha chain